MVELVIIHVAITGRHRLNALAIARADQPNHIGRVHPPARPMTKRIHERLKPAIGAQAIVAFTQSGSTALRVARERPDCLVLGLATSREASRRLAVVWEVHAALTDEVHSMTEATASAVRTARQKGFAKKGDEMIVVAGVPFGQPGTTNALRVARVKKAC